MYCVVKNIVSEKLAQGQPKKNYFTNRRGMISQTLYFQAYGVVMPIRMNKNSKVSFVAYGIRMCEVGWKALYGIKD